MALYSHMYQSSAIVSIRYVRLSPPSAADYAFDCLRDVASVLSRRVGVAVDCLLHFWFGAEARV